MAQFSLKLEGCPLGKALQFIFLSFSYSSSGTWSLSLEGHEHYRIKLADVTYHDFPMQIIVIWLSKIKHLFRGLTTAHSLSLEDDFLQCFRWMAPALGPTPGMRGLSNLYSEAVSGNGPLPSLRTRWVCGVHQRNSSGFSAYTFKGASSSWQSLSDLTEQWKIYSLKWEKRKSRSVCISFRPYVS